LARIKVRYLERRRLADGSTAYYYCPPGNAQKAGVALPAALGKEPIAAAAKAEEQNKRIDDWRAGKEPGRAGPVPGSVAWLVNKFEDSHQFKRKKPATRAFYTGALKALCGYQLETVKLGDVQARALAPKHADKMYLALQKIDPDTEEPTQLPWANAIMRSARRVFSLGVRWGDVDINPFAKMELSGRASPRGGHPAGTCRSVLRDRYKYWTALDGSMGAAFLRVVPTRWRCAPIIMDAVQRARGPGETRQGRCSRTGTAASRLARAEGAARRDAGAVAGHRY
jgi:hypothetical protein